MEPLLLNGKRFIVTGSPGVGKSIFGIYFAIQLLKKKKNIVFRSIAGKPFFYTFLGSSEKFEITSKSIGEKDYVMLLDGKEKEDIDFATNFARFPKVLFSSPSEQNYNIFKKEDCTFICMNVWEKEEMEQLAIELDYTDWFPKYNIVGGIPRIVFDGQNEDQLYRKVKNAIPDDINELKKFYSQVKKERSITKESQRAPHILFNIYTPEFPYDYYYPVFASLCIEKIISINYKLEFKAFINDIIKTTKPELQSYRGSLLQNFYLEQLSTTINTIKFRCLEEDSKYEEYTNPEFKTAIVQLIDEVPLEIPSLCIPISKIFPSIDAFIVDTDNKMIIYIQCTVSQNHSIKYDPTKSIYDLLNKKFLNFRHLFLFMVSQDIYETYKKQPYMNKNNANRERKPDFDIQQFVGYLPDKKE